MSDEATTTIEHTNSDQPAAKPDVPDSIEYLKSGRVRFVIDGRTYTLAPPKVGAYSMLLVAWQDEVVGATEERQLSDRILDWWEKVFMKLGDKPLAIERDDLPAWMVNGSLPTDVFNHWREVPLSPS